MESIILIYAIYIHLWLLGKIADLILYINCDVTNCPAMLQTSKSWNSRNKWGYLPFSNNYSNCNLYIIIKQIRTYSKIAHSINNLQASSQNRLTKLVFTFSCDVIIYWLRHKSAQRFLRENRYLGLSESWLAQNYVSITIRVTSWIFADFQVSCVVVVDLCTLLLEIFTIQDGVCY